MLCWSFLWKALAPGRSDDPSRPPRASAFHRKLRHSMSSPPDVQKEGDLDVARGLALRGGAGGVGP